MTMKIHRSTLWLADTNAFIVETGDGKAIVVDAPPDPDKLGSEIAELGLTVAAVLLTHGHVDHTGGAGQISSEHGAVAYVHPDDDFLTLHPTEQLMSFYGMVPPGSYDLPQQIEYVEHGQVLDLAGVQFEVRHTPGHTPGHICFHVEAEGLLFSGDQLFAGSIGRSDLPGGSFDDLIKSMREQIMTLDDEVRVLPGHGPDTTIGQERRSNPFRDHWS